MPTTIHELLDDTKNQCQALVNEINAFKSARSLNQKATEALDSTCEALKATTKAIKPLTEQNVRRMTIILLAATSLNTILFVATLLLIIFRK